MSFNSADRSLRTVYKEKLVVVNTCRSHITGQGMGTENVRWVSCLSIVTLKMVPEVTLSFPVLPDSMRE